VPLSQRRSKTSWAALGRVLQQAGRDGILPLLSTEETSAVLSLDLGSLLRDRREHTGPSPTKVCKENESTGEKERLKGLGLFFLEKRRLRGILSVCINT